MEKIIKIDFTSFSPPSLPSSGPSDHIDGSFLQVSREINELREKLNREILSKKQISTIEVKMRELQEKVTDREDLISLHGRIQTVKTNNEIDTLFEEAQDLALHKEEYSLEELTDKMLKVQERVKDIWINNGLEVENIRYIRATLLNLQKVELFLSSKTADVVHHPKYSKGKSGMMHLLKTEIGQPIFEGEEWEVAETALYLCEIAHLFYQDKIGEGLNKLNQLEPSQRIHLEEHALLTGAEFPKLEMPQDRASYRDNTIRFIQALIGCANAIVQGESFSLYPSQEEIDEMFHEANNFSEI
jgi:hypothetical protein